MNREFWKGKKVFLTGHTGFKGAWMTSWLVSMEAEVFGYSLPPNTNPSMFDLLELGKCINSDLGDIRNLQKLSKALISAQPDIVIHMAAQPIVSSGYLKPLETFEVNVIGTANLLEACRSLTKKTAILIVSSDKCYSNENKGIRFKEDDPLGGNDPYSASKAGTEIVANSYRYSYFSEDKSEIMVATARAGNVIGGGDWAENRLIPDAVRSVSDGKSISLRNPIATRPWQHVLEPLHGYLHLLELMYQDKQYADSWNFGASKFHNQSVEAITNKFVELWGHGSTYEIKTNEQSWREAKTLSLDCTKAERLLNWKSLLTLDETLELTVDGYKSLITNNQPKLRRSTIEEQLRYYENGRLDNNL